ncbi:MAG: hypothetical protein ACLT4F_08995 [Clostridia bacterium]
MNTCNKPLIFRLEVVDNYALENNIEKINVTNIIPTGFEYMDRTGTLHFVSFKKIKKLNIFCTKYNLDVLKYNRGIN